MWWVCGAAGVRGLVWAIAWPERTTKTPPIAARSGILIVSLPVESVNALRPGHMLGVAPAIVNRDSRPVQTRVGVDTFVVPRVQAPRGQRGRGPAAIR